MAKLLIALISLLSLINCVSADLPAVPPAAHYGTLQFQQAGNVTRVTFNHPPINLCDNFLISDILDFLIWIQPSSNRTTPVPKVVIFDSALEEYYLGHIDITSIQQPVTPEKLAFTLKYVAVANFLSNTTSTVFVAEINGNAFGAGQELTVQMDMRFAGPNARSGAFEDMLGLIAGGGGQIFFATLMNRGQALEYLLAGKALDGPTGTRLGLFNNNFETKQELTAAVDALTQRIGLFPAAGLNQTKASLMFRNPTLEQFNQDVLAFYNLDPLAVEQANVAKVLAASQNQTDSPFERQLPDSILQFYE